MERHPVETFEIWLLGLFLLIIVICTIGYLLLSAFDLVIKIRDRWRKRALDRATEGSAGSSDRRTGDPPP